MQTLTQLATLKVAPDADLDAISTLESQILDLIKRPQQEALMRLAQAGGVVPGMSGPPGGGQPAGPPMGGAVGPPQMGMGMGGPSMSGSGEGVRGVRNGGAMPPVDELRRLIASSSLA